jgi:hypothetical protein
MEYILIGAILVTILTVITKPSTHKDNDND